MLNSTIPAGLERRTEDYRLITGQAFYVDDIRLPQGRPAALHVAMVRSPYAHAEVKGYSTGRGKGAIRRGGRICRRGAGGRYAPHGDHPFARPQEAGAPTTGAGARALRG